MARSGLRIKIGPDISVIPQLDNPTGYNLWGSLVGAAASCITVLSSLDNTQLLNSVTSPSPRGPPPEHQTPACHMPPLTSRTRKRRDTHAQKTQCDMQATCHDIRNLTFWGSWGRYKSLVTGKRARTIIAVFWILSFVIGLIPLMGWNRLDENCHEPGTSYNCTVKCLFEKVVTMSYMVYFNFFGCVLLPLLIMLGIYIKIFMVARKQLRQIELKCVGSDSSRTTLQKEINAAKSLAIIVGLFAFCWLPIHILNCITLFEPDFYKTKPEWVMYMAIILSHANSVVNPIIYAYKIRDFRYTFRKILSKYIVCRKDNFSKCPNGTISHNRQLQISSVSAGDAIM
ncbi:hypothetical protein XELAEV_18011655mg [Xenopus laevis]|uniref:G-protein coupled receptors family 1 profile domain-containing protein n=1 Tax=Xenopus laevis TaxID=8355 RepID=A0A974HXE0_XENLA|nr:hypothetical protein XELAEV_18011655mg [Xenopus laevis]